MGPRDFFNKKSKFGFFPKNFGSKKNYIQPQIGNKKFFGKKTDTSFNRNFGNKSLIYSNSNFLNHYGKKINSPKGFDEFKKFKNNGKNKMYKGKENYDDNHGKNIFGGKKYYERKIKDDFEVDLESDDESNNEKSKENNTNNKMPFYKTINDFFRDNSLKKEENNNIDENEKDSDDDSEKKNVDDLNKKIIEMEVKIDKIDDEIKEYERGEKV